MSIRSLGHVLRCWLLVFAGCVSPSAPSSITPAAAASNDADVRAHAYAVFGARDTGDGSELDRLLDPRFVQVDQSRVFDRTSAIMWIPARSPA